jgi:hypothetical protein
VLQGVFKPFLGQKTVFRVKITFKMVLISRMKGVGVGVGVGVGRGRGRWCWCWAWACVLGVGV